MESHVALVSIAEIRTDIAGPLICLGENHAICVVGVDFGTDSLDNHVGFRQVLTICLVAFDEVRNGVEAYGVPAEVEPVTQNLQYLLHHNRIIEIQIRLWW